MLFVDPRDEQPSITFDDGGSDFGNLIGGLPFPENNLWKAFPQRTVQIHFSKSEVRDRRGLESVQDLFATNVARPEFFQQGDGFG